MADPVNASTALKRFYKDVTVEAGGDGYSLRLDGRAPRSPGARPLVLPTRALADLVAEEWRAQAVTVVFAAMPATRLAHTAIDVVASARAASVEGVTRFGETDLLCYFADHPRNLVYRQEKVWGPLLDWARDTLDLDFRRTAGIVHRPQPPRTLVRLEALVQAADDFTLAGLAVAASLFGSAILALALQRGRIKAEEAMGAARLDEIFQEEQWGVDAEAEARADAMAVRAVMVERWFGALKG